MLTVEIKCKTSRYFFRFMEDIIQTMREKGKDGTADNYRAALNSFSKFMKRKEILIESISAVMIEKYESWLYVSGVCANTVSFYMRILRAVYNRAVDDEIIADKRPFRHVYTGIDKTVKRALSLNAIKKIRTLDLSGYPQLVFARDMFMMSLYLRGMSFVDMCFLRKSDIRDGYLVYRRRKTGQLLKIAWTHCMQQIVDLYDDVQSDYLLPIINSRTTNERSSYKNASYMINRNLKKIGNMIKERKLTMYVARHSWASIARAGGVPIGVISEAMGHESEMTTRIYLTSLDTSVVDKANELVISLI